MIFNLPLPLTVGEYFDVKVKDRRVDTDTVPDIVKVEFIRAGVNVWLLEHIQKSDENLSISAQTATQDIANTLTIKVLCSKPNDQFCIMGIHLQLLSHIRHLDSTPNWILVIGSGL